MNPCIWIVFSFFLTNVKQWVSKELGVLFQSSIYHSNHFLSCRTHCIHSTLKCNNAYSCIATWQSAKWCLSPWFTRRHQLYLCQASRSKIHRWQIVFYNLDLQAPWKSEGKKAVSFFSFTHSGWSVARVIFRLSWSSVEGFYWFQQGWIRQCS